MNPYYLFLFFTILNVFAFAAFGIDKYLAIKKYRRISEKRLLQLAVFGGSIGAFAGQRVFRHKTYKFKGILQGILFVHATLLCGAAWLMFRAFAA